MYGPMISCGRMMHWRSLNASRSALCSRASWCVGFRRILRANWAIGLRVMLPSYQRNMNTMMSRNMNTMNTTCHCLRCGYDWTMRGQLVTRLPRQCPYCKSPKWNLERASETPAPQPAKLDAALPKIAAQARVPMAMTTGAALLQQQDGRTVERDDYSQA